MQDRTLLFFAVAAAIVGLLFLSFSHNLSQASEDSINGTVCSIIFNNSTRSAKIIIQHRSTIILSSANASCIKRIRKGDSIAVFYTFSRKNTIFADRIEKLGHKT